MERRIAAHTSSVMWTPRTHCQWRPHLRQSAFPACSGGAARAWKRSAACTAATRSANCGGASALSVMAMRSSRCSRSGPSFGLNVAISSGRHLQERELGLGLK